MTTVTVPQPPHLGGRRRRCTKIQLNLTEEEQQTIAHWLHHGLVHWRVERRLEAMLLIHEGWRISDVAHAVGLSRPKIYKWIARFLAQRCVGLFSPFRPRTELIPEVMVDATMYENK